MVKRKSSIKIAIALRLICTRDRRYLIIITHKNSIHIMGTIGLRHINKLGRYISHRAMLVNKILYRHIRRDRHLIRCLYEVIIAIKNTRYIWHVRHNRENLMKIELIQRNSHILQGFKIFIIGEYLNTHSIVGLQLHICRHTPIIA